MPERRHISTGSPFESRAGFSRAIAVGPWCFVSGTTGYDYATMTMPQGVEAQTRNIFGTIRKVLLEAGFAYEDLVRVNYYIAEQADVEMVFAAAREFFAEIRPAATFVVCGLVDPAMKVEVEATAFKG